MLNDLSEQIHHCLLHAEGCAEQAAVLTDPQLKQDFLDMERRWFALARSYQFSQSLTDFSKGPHAHWLKTESLPNPAFAHIRFGSVTDIPRIITEVRFTPQSGRQSARLAGVLCQKATPIRTAGNGGLALPGSLITLPCSRLLIRVLLRSIACLFCTREGFLAMSEISSSVRCSMPINTFSAALTRISSSSFA